MAEGTKGDDSSKRLKNGTLARGSTFYIVRLAVLALMIGIAFLIFHSRSDHNPIPTDIRNSASFTIYYPEHLPLNQKSIQLTNDNKLLTYTVDDNGTPVYVSIQDKPQYFDFADFDKGIKTPVTVNTAYGNATVGKLGGRMVGDLPAADSWILVSATSNTSPDKLVDVLKDLKKS